MATLLDAALGGDAWALSGLLFGLTRALDTDGRPIAERRAPSDVKDDVPMVLRACPYHDERQGEPMNVSALAQLTAQFGEVLDEVAGFHDLAAAQTASWDGMLAAVVDQLAGPAYFLLREGTPGARVPARISAGHKLAAGFFDVMRRILREEARGGRREVTSGEFLSFVRETRALIGSSEVCAGPPNMIAQATEVFLNGGRRASPVPVQPWRLDVARLLVDQMRLGLAWELFDSEVEYRHFLCEEEMARLEPRNAFIDGKLRRRAAKVAEERAAYPPHELAGTAGAELISALIPGAGQGVLDRETATEIETLIAYGQGAILVGETHRRRLARSMSAYLDVYREIAAAACELELEIRARLDLPASAPLMLTPLMRPRSHALAWFEAVCGHQLEAGSLPRGELTLRNHHRSVQLGSALGTEPR